MDFCEEYECTGGPNVFPIEEQPSNPPIGELANTGNDPILMGVLGVALLVVGIVSTFRRA